MPELPYVEFMRRRLRSRIRGRRIARAEILDQGFVGFGRTASRDRLEGARILDVTRRAKFLLVALDSGSTLLLRRVGGRVALARGTDPTTLAPLRRLGIEPLSPRFRLEELDRRARAFRGAVKCLLMAQARIAGIGNLYSDEILFRARIHPAVQARTLDGKRLRVLYDAIRAVLQEATRDLPGLDRKRAWLMNHRAETKRCPRCRARIRRLRLCGRSSYFCPRCQPPSSAGFAGAIGPGGRQRAGRRPAQRRKGGEAPLRG